MRDHRLEEPRQPLNRQLHTATLTLAGYPVVDPYGDRRAVGARVRDVGASGSRGVTRAAKPASVRFYIDADVLGLARLLVQVRSDVTFPGDAGGIKYKRVRSPCPLVFAETSDSEWIPKVAELGWLIIMRDSNIRAHRAEVAAVRDNAARTVALSGKDATNTGGTCRPCDPVAHDRSTIG